MEIGAFYQAARNKIVELGEHGTTLWMNPADWEELSNAIGPPPEVRREQARKRGYTENPPPPQDGDAVGRFEFCAMHVHSRIPQGTVRVRKQVGVAGRSIDLPVGPFEPAVEPADGWPEPLYLPAGG